LALNIGQKELSPRVAVHRILFPYPYNYYVWCIKPNQLHSPVPLQQRDNPAFFSLYLANIGLT